MFWVTSDQHYNHANILTKFVFRPFSNVEHMNRELARRHNERVKPGHIVYHLGDFKLTSEGPNTHELLDRLNGRHVMIVGNHDKNNGSNTPLKFCVIETYRRQIVLTHRPEHCEFYMGLLGINLGFCGHVHDKWKFKSGKYGDLINVGVDQWDFYPIDAKQIFKAYKSWKTRNSSFPIKG